MLISQAVEQKLIKAVEEGNVGSYTVLDNCIPFELILEGEWLTPVSVSCASSTLARTCG